VKTIKEYLMGLSSEMIGNTKFIQDAFIVNSGDFKNIFAGTPCIVIQNDKFDGNSIIKSRKMTFCEDAIVAAHPALHAQEEDVIDGYDDDSEEDGPMSVPIAHKNIPTKVVLPFGTSGDRHNRQRIVMEGIGTFSVVIPDKKESLLDRATFIDLVDISPKQANKSDYISKKITSMFNVGSIINGREFVTVASGEIQNASGSINIIINKLLKSFPNIFTLSCNTKNIYKKKDSRRAFDLKLLITISNASNHMPMLEQFNGVILHICVIDMKRTNAVEKLDVIFEATLLFSDTEYAGFVDGERILNKTNMKSMNNYINKNIRCTKPLRRYKK